MGAQRSHAGNLGRYCPAGSPAAPVLPALPAPAGALATASNALRTESGMRWNALPESGAGLAGAAMAALALATWSALWSTSGAFSGAASELATTKSAARSGRKTRMLSGGRMNSAEQGWLCHGLSRRRHAAEVAHVAAAINRRVAVQHFAPFARARQADPVLQPRHRRQIQDHHQLAGRAPRPGAGRRARCSDGPRQSIQRKPSGVVVRLATGPARPGRACSGPRRTAAAPR